MMKKILIISGFMVLGVAMISCSKIRRNPGRAYMPDMAYSRAYETYSSTEGLKKEHANYTALPVPGTVARGDMFPYTVPNDSTGAALSRTVKNPFDSIKVDLKEAERLYLVNCGICHGEKLNGQGPIVASGAYPISAKDLMADDSKQMADGYLFHVITYGKGNMGSYASQLSSPQRWMVVSYIRKMQHGGAKSDSTAKTTVNATNGTTAAKDSTGK